MIDGDGYRLNVGIVICNNHGQVFWAKRYGQHSWQFPQGGIDEGESPEQAMFRELYEEVGLTKKDVKIIATSRHWLRYKLPNAWCDGIRSLSVLDKNRNGSYCVWNVMNQKSTCSVVMPLNLMVGAG